MSSLPPLAPAATSSKKPQPDTASQRSVSTTASKKSKGNAVEPQQKPTAEATDQPAPASATAAVQQQAAETGSHRSAHSHQSSQRTSTSVSKQSISSSVALSKLQQLEEMLLKERRARETAEATLLAVQRERAARDEATRQSAQAQRQLAEVMSALQSVVACPDEKKNVERLQQILRGNAVRGDVAGTPADPAEKPASQSSSQRAPQDKQQRSFLDGIGQYERARQKDKKARRQQLDEEMKQLKEKYKGRTSVPAPPSEGKAKQPN